MSWRLVVVFFFWIAPQDISRFLEKCHKIFTEFIFLSLVKSLQDGGLILTGVKLREFHSFMEEVISINVNAKSQYLTII